MKVLDLFSGIGGFALGLERAGMETVAFCEYDEKARLVLNKHWPNVPMYNDVRTLTGEQLEKDGITDIGLICGGYPCQSFSVAGKRKGQADDRYLWPEFFRLIKEIRPTWVIAENVAGHINMGLDSVLADLESEAYQCQTFLIGACAVDAQHRRDRVWIIANSDSSISGNQWQDEMLDHRQMDKRKTFSVNNGNTRIVAHSDSVNWSPNEGKPNAKADGRDKSSGGGKVVADTMYQGLQGGEETGNPESGGKGREKLPARCSERSQPGNWLPEPSVGKLADGIPARLERGRLNADERWLQVSRQKDAGGILRELRDYRDTLRPSQGQGLDEQRSIEYSDALQFLSYILASCGGGDHAEDREAALYGLWKSLVQVKSEAMQYAPNQVEAIWESITDAQADWIIVAVVHGCFWSEPPEVPRVASGVPRRVDRLKQLGNAVVPQIPEVIGRFIMEIENGA